MSERLLPFPRSEFDRRRAQVESALSDQGLDGALITGPENLYYLTGNPISGPMALLLRPGIPPLLFADEYDEYNIQTYSWIEEARFHPVGQSWLDLVPQALGSGLRRVGIDVKSSALSVSTYTRLHAQLPAPVELVDTTAVEEARLVKSSAELECVRAAAGIATAAMRAGLAATSPGRTENDIAAEIYRAAIAEGSEHLASQPYVKAGTRAWVTHGRWQGTAIRSGDTVFIELAGCVKRYHAALMRSAVCGDSTPRTRRVAEAVLASLEAALGALRPGVPACDVDRAYREVIARAGFGPYNRHALGYSIGVAFAPGWGEPEIFMISPSEPRPIRTGMTFHLVPSVTIPREVGHIACSATVVITETGAEVLTQMPNELVSV